MRLAAAALLLFLSACDRCGSGAWPGGRYPLSTPPEARVRLALPTLAGLGPAEVSVIERQLRASAAWSVFVERGRHYAFRRRLEGGVWQSGSNGFHSDFASGKVLQSRVALGLPGEYGFGVERGNVTRAAASDGSAQLVLEKYMDQPGLQSYLIVRGGGGASLEVFEQAEGPKREFTDSALRTVEAELAAMVAAAPEIRAHGYAAALTPPDSVRRAPAPPLVVHDGMQGGMYGVEAWLNPGADGVVHTRVFFAGQDAVRADHRLPPELRGRPPTQLSEASVSSASQRLVGWSPDARDLFRYQAGLTVYEGDWEHSYPARFEVWFRPADGGAERKLAEAARDISGWER